MIDEIRAEVERRGITRLCHFTPTRNLVHILTDQQGLLPRSQLDANQAMPFTATDTERFDGYRTHHSCTVEYPNLWYFERAKGRDKVFQDWTLLFLRRDYLWKLDTQFCPHNAALYGGRDVGAGEQTFRRMFATSVVGSGGKARHRTESHLLCSPTDDQAEVLIPGIVFLRDIIGMAVPSVESARDHWVRLQLLGMLNLNLPIIVAPALFDKYALRQAIVMGKRPEEVLWHANN